MVNDQIPQGGSIDATANYGPGIVGGMAGWEGRSQPTNLGTTAIDLSLRDVKILALLHRERGRAVSRDQLFEEAWGLTTPLGRTGLGTGSPNSPPCVGARALIGSTTRWPTPARTTPAPTGE